ncbi:MAG TPA: 4Fe-4S dicluster domain-containing protein [Ignavibacteria bacterium]|nr:4Fe-4S ferredoxin [Bacteroidota bacterium]HRI85476.1 4Fe-4S dicluster domain-containing protein [Ignavibacteria bacterium]HRK00779.1 4Fe-4S dicluster domain-containing protein [Ignavibacteria bacterium]
MNTEKPKTVRERKLKGKVVFDIQKCKGCELCITACKEGGLKLSEKLNSRGYRYVIANNDLCTGCINCALVCPDAVITVYRTDGKKKKIEINTGDKNKEKDIISSILKEIE